MQFEMENKMYKLQTSLHQLDRQIVGKMNNEARVIYNSIVNDPKLLPLSSFKSTKFSKYNLFPHAQSLPTFFEYNLQNEGRIVKFLKGPEAALRGFYYQLFKLAFEMENNYNYPSIIKNLVFSPVLTFQSQPVPLPKSQTYSQYKRIIAEFIALLESQVIPNAQLTFSQYPIIDEAMLVILELVLDKLEESGRIGPTRTNMEVLCALCEIFRIKYEIYENCFSFEDSDVFLYIESEEVCYLAFLSEMAQVESYQKTSQSPHQNQFASIHQNGTSNSYIEPHYGYGSEHNNLPRDIRLSAGNRGNKTKIMNKSSHSYSANKNSFGSSSFGGGRSHKVIGDYQDRHSPQIMRDSKSSQQYANDQKQISHQSIEQGQDYRDDRLHQQSYQRNEQTNEERVERQINQLRNEYSNMKSQSEQESRLYNSRQIRNSVQKNVFEDLDMPQNIVSNNSISAYEVSHYKQHMHQYFIEPSVTQLPASHPPESSSEQSSQALTSQPILPIISSSSSVNMITQQPPNQSQALHAQPAPSSPLSSNNNLKNSRTHSPKSIYEVRTYKSIDSVQESKQSKVDSNYDSTAMLGAVGEYMLMKKRQSNAAQYVNIRNSRKNEITSNLSQIIKEEIANGHKEKENQHEERARGRSQVKLQDKIFQYEFKSHKYRNYSTHSPSPHKLPEQYYPSQTSQTPISTVKDISHSISQQNKSASAIPSLPGPISVIDTSSPNLNVNLHVNLHLNLSSIGEMGWKGDAYPTMETSKDREYRQKYGNGQDDGSGRKTERYNKNNNREQAAAQNQNLQRTMQKTIQKTIDKTLDRTDKHLQTEHIPSIYNPSKQVFSINENQYKSLHQQKPKSKVSQQNDQQFNFYKPTIKNNSNNNKTLVLLPEIIKKHDENILQTQNMVDKIISKQNIGSNIEAGQRQRQKLVVNSFNNANSKNNDDSLGTFYRQFSDTKVMQAMIEPYKTKVRATRHKFKGIRSKNFKGFA